MSCEQQTKGVFALARWWLLGFFVVLFALGMPIACGTPQVRIQLYQSGSQIKLAQLGTVLKPPLSLTANDGVKELIDVGSSDVKLPTFGCKEWLAKASTSTDGTLLGLVPSLVINGFVDGKLALSGRFPVDVACRRLQASILMAPVGQLSSWKPREDKRTDTAASPWSRIGLSVVRLPDGRFLATGGAGEIRFDSKGLPVVAKALNTSFVYDPATGALQDGPTLSSPRAFHGAVVLEQQVYLLGGLQDDGKLASVEGWRLPGFAPIASGDISPIVKSLPPRAFQKVLKIERQGAGSSRETRVVQLGGISCGPALMGPSCVGDQLLHSQVVFMPKREFAMVIGGMFYEKESNEWRPLGDIHVFPYADLSGTFSLGNAKETIGLLPSRMGHIAVRQDDKRVWIYGGLVVPRDGTASILGANRISSTQLINVGENGRLSLQGLFSVGSDRFLTRAMAVGMPLDKGRVLVVGGLVRAPANDSDPGELAANALILDVDPGDSSGSTLRVHSLPHAPQVKPAALMLPTGQHWVFGGYAPSGSANGPFPPSAVIQLLNPLPEGSMGELLKFELLRTDTPTPDGGEPPRDTTLEPPADRAASDRQEPIVEKPAVDSGETTKESSQEPRTEVTPDASTTEPMTPEASPINTGISWCRKSGNLMSFANNDYYKPCQSDEFCALCKDNKQCEQGAGICAKTDCATARAACQMGAGICSSDVTETGGKRFCFRGCKGDQSARYTYDAVCPLGQVCEAAANDKPVYSGGVPTDHCVPSDRYEGYATGNKMLGETCTKVDGCDGRRGFFCNVDNGRCERACDPRTNGTIRCPSGQRCVVSLSSFLQGRCQ